MPKRTDRNQLEIVKALRGIGASVQSLADIGKGCPDLLVSYRNSLYLFEVKNGALPPSQRVLTSDEKRWHYRWRDTIYVVKSVDEAIKIITAPRNEFICDRCHFRQDPPQGEPPF